MTTSSITCNTYRQLIAPRNKLFWRTKSGIWRPLRRSLSVLMFRISLHVLVGRTSTVLTVEELISFASTPRTFVYSKYETFSVRRYPGSSRLRAKSRHSHLFQSIITISLRNLQLQHRHVRPVSAGVATIRRGAFRLLQLPTDGNILMLIIIIIVIIIRYGCLCHRHFFPVLLSNQR